MIVEFPPPPLRISNFQKELFTFYETSERQCVVRVGAVVSTLLPTTSGLGTPLLLDASFEIEYLRLCKN